MEYSAQNLEYAVSVFYNGEQSDRAKAHAWLTAAQRVPEAWNFVWELLQPSKATEIQFYAATTLHTKILRCWNEVPPESYDELKDKLLQAVFTYSKGPKIVTNRLCISLAAFILQQGTVDLATILRPLSTKENTTLLLEVLTVIPEEYNSMTMGSALRSKNRTALLQACPAVLDDMLQCLGTVYYTDYDKEPPSMQTMQSWVTAATCACSWLTLGGDDAASHPSGALPERMPLCNALLTIVKVMCTWNPAVSDVPLDVCEACLLAVRAAGCTGAERYRTSVMDLLCRLAELAGPLMMRDNVPNSINEELLAALITCCVSMCECHVSKIIGAVETAGGSEEHNGARQLIELMLATQAAPGYYPLHETRSNLTFGFWYSLQDDLVTIMEEKTMQPIWRQVFSRLLTTLVSKSAAPADVSLSKDDLELLRCYRQDIADTVMFCYGIVGDQCWAIVDAAFSAATNDSGREAALHVFGALADAAPAQRAPSGLVVLIHHALNVAHTSTNKRMLNTALDCLGGYASWVSARGARSLGLACVRAAGAALPRCAPAAALALRKLASDCSAPAAALAPDIVQAAQTFQSSSGRSDAWVRRQLVAAAGAALAAAALGAGEADADEHDERPRRRSAAGLELVAAGPLLRPLAESLRDELASQAGDTARAVLAAECCAALLGSLAPCGPLAADLFRTLAPALPPYASNQALVEPLFHILKQTVSSLIDNLIQLISDIAQLIVAGFNTYPCASGLDIVKLVVIALGAEWGSARALLHASVSASVRALAPDPSARPDLTEGLFALLQAVTKKRPHFIDWLDDILPDLLELACGCVQMCESAGARAACGWLSALAAQRPDVLQPRAPALTGVVLSCIGGATPRNHIEPLAELLLGLNRAAWRDAGLSVWLRHALATPGFPTPHATDPHKHKFIQAVIKEKSSKRRLLQTVQEFSLVCRGLVDTEYARQTIASKQLVA